MFCKWCGGPLSPSDSKCTRCGKNVPPLSDCGGFYDLMPGAQRNEVPARRTEQRGTANLPKAESGMHKTTAKQAGRVHTYITVLGLVLVIVLLIVLFSKLNRYAEKVEELQAELQRVSEQISDNDDEANGSGKDKNPWGDITPSETKEGKRTETTTEPPESTTAPTEDTTDPDAEPDTTSSDENEAQPQKPDEPEL